MYVDGNKIPRIFFLIFCNFCQKTSQFLGGKGGSIVSLASSLTLAFWLYDEHLSDCETPWLGHLFPWGRSYYIALSRTSILSRVSPGDQNLIVLTESPSITTPTIQEIMGQNGRSKVINFNLFHLRLYITLLVTCS